MLPAAAGASRCRPAPSSAPSSRHRPLLRPCRTQPCARRRGTAAAAAADGAAAAEPQQPLISEQLRGAVIATAVCCAFVSNVGAARAAADSSWMPRRHHRHIGERFSDTWADSIVEVEYATTARIKDLERQLDYEKKRADSESARRREAEQKLKVLAMQQKAARPAADDDAWLRIHVLGADVTGPLAFALLFGGIYYGWQRSSGAGGRAAKGRWVYDRGLGGKKVWVPFPVPGSSELPDHMSDSAFDELATKAATLAATQRQKQQQPFAPPTWWQPPMSFAADAATKASAQLQASSIMTRLEQAKNKGEDYQLTDIAALRRTCQAGGGVTVDARTVGGRDAIYKAAVDAAVRSCIEPGSVDESDLADTPALQFVAGVAQDLQIPDERAIGLAANWVAGHCRSRIVEAYTASKKGDDVASTQCLYQLAQLLRGLPIIEASSSQVELIADELKGWAEPEVLQRLQGVLLQLVEEQEQQRVASAMLGLPLQ